jgi:arylsulfatase A-like enzyme
VTDWIAGHNRPFAKLKIPDWRKELDLGETTIAEVLHERGYVSAHFGKWHLEHTAKDHGFDVTVGDNGKGSPNGYLPPYHNPNLPDGPPGEELTARLTSEAEKFIDANRAKPFFVYFAPYAVHTPLGGKPEVIAKYKAKADPNAPQHNPTYAAMVQAVDDSVGSLRAKLDALGLSENTVFIFTSDNGGLELNQITYNLGLRAGKGSAYEGGVREIGLVRWPGLTKPGSVCTTPAITLDWPMTIAAATGAKLPGSGVDVRPLLRGETIAPRPLFWHYPHYHPGGATPYSAVREGDWRLVHFYEDDHVELYDLAHDAEEKNDLAAAQPERAKTLRAKLDAWRKEVGAQVPTPNPNYDPSKDKQPKRKPEA